MDPRVSLYSEILARYEFGEWGDLEPRFQRMKARLNSMLPALWDIPHVKKNTRVCYVCAENLQDHECFIKPCENCNNSSNTCTDSSCIYYHLPIKEKLNRFSEKISYWEVLQVRCIKCRNIGHTICI